MAELDIGIDLGTTSTIIYVKHKGVILREPSVVAFDNHTNRVLAVGNQAYNMLGKTPAHITALHPLSEGVVSDYQAAQKMIKIFLEKIIHSKLIRPRIAICVPSQTTEVEAMSVIDAASYAGARKVYLIEEPIAAAIGAGIDISQPRGHMIIDIGGGTTDIAVISLNDVVVSNSVKCAGNHMNDEIIRYISSTYKMLIGEKMAEMVKIKIGNVYYDTGESVIIKGRNHYSGLPESREISCKELMECLCVCADKIAVAANQVLEATPPELHGDIYENGIILTGGGAMLNGLGQYLSKKLQVKVTLAENPIECVAIGTGEAFRFDDILHEGINSPSNQGRKYIQ